MEEKVTSATTNKKTSSEKPPISAFKKSVSKKINYECIDKESLSEIIGKSLPRQLIPTKKTGSIFGLIFLAVIIIAGIQFPFSQLLSGNADITISIGYPWHFLEFDLLDVEKSPLLLLNLFLDLIIYIILAYMIDVILNLILHNPLTKSKEEIKRRPVVFKDKKPTIAEKVTKKVFEK